MKLRIAAFFTLFISTTSFGADGPCGKFSIADMNWNSATFIAHVDQFILEHGFGCNAALVPGNTQVSGKGILEQGAPDVIPEFWSNAMKDDLDHAVAESRVVHAGTPFSDGAIEGFWVPAYMVERNPELATIEGVLKNVTTFSPRTSAAPFYGCPTGWNCHISSRNLFKALGLKEAGFEFVAAKTGADLTGTLQEAYEDKSPWFGYYWSPTAVLGKYKMYKVDFGTSVSKEEFERCTSKADCKDPQVTMYPTPLVQTIVTGSFAARFEKPFEYLSRRGWTDEQMNEVLAWMEENQADGEAAMEHFLTNYKSTWVKWVDGGAARSIRKALEDF